MEQSETPEEVLVTRDENGVPTITEAGHRLLSLCVTDTVGPVYAILESVPASVTAAAMARLSRCGDDLRVILLNEFASSLPREVVKRDPGKELAMLKRVITAYGDDSVQQLGSLYVVVQGASNLLSKILERPRIGIAYLEQSTRYIFFFQKIITGYGEDGSPIFGYRYYVPAELNETERAEFIQEMDGIFDNYSIVVKKLQEQLIKSSTEPEESRDAAWRSAIRAQACDSARFMLPAATTTTIGIHGSAQALDSLIMHLLGHELLEARRIGQAMLKEVRKVAPVFFERTDMPDRGGATTAYLRESRDQFKKTCNTLGCNSYTQSEPVKLVDFHPTNENDAISRLPYAAGCTPKVFSEEELVKILESYIGNRMNRRHRRGRLLEMTQYTFYMHTGYAEFRDLQRHRIVSAFEWLNLETGKDFEIPEPIIKHGLSHQFKDAFLGSESVCEMLNFSHGPVIAQYGTLFGHKMNWTWTLNLRELMHIVELRTAPGGHPAYRKLCQQMYDAVAAVHPKLAKTIQFVNRGEDPELTRLASERAAAFKLSQLQ